MRSIGVGALAAAGGVSLAALAAGTALASSSSPSPARHVEHAPFRQGGAARVPVHHVERASFRHGGATRVRTDLLRPFRSTTAGDLYHVTTPSDISGVRLVGYRRHALAVRALKSHVRRGVLALTTSGEVAREQQVAAAHGSRLRRDHGLLLARRAHRFAAMATASGYAGAVEGTSGLVSYWRLDEASGGVANDSFGSNPGSYGGYAGSSYTLGSPGLIAGDADTAVAFGYGGVTVPGSSSLQPGSKLSVEAWIDPGSTEANGYIAAKGGSWRLRFDSNSHLTFGVFLSGSEYQAIYGHSISPGTIHHVVGTYDGSAVRLYVDGALVASRSRSAKVSSSSQPLWIAYNGGTSTTYHFKGTIDEVAYYGAALSLSQVQSHYSAGGGGGSAAPSSASSGGTPAPGGTTSTTSSTPATTTTTTTTTTAPPPPSPPTATITSGPANGSTQSSSSASFGFSSNQSGSTFQCSLDGASYASCTSPATYSSLSNGSHTFSVKAVDNGLTSNPASVTWTVSVTTSSGSCTPFYSADSPWNTPISSNPTVDPSNAAYLATLTQNTDYPKLGSDPTQYTMPLYVIDSSTPNHPVTLSGGYYNVTSPTNVTHLSQPTVQVPIPVNAQPAAGSDAQVIVWNPATGDEWGFWEFANSSGSMTATNGYHYNTLWSGVPPQYFGSRGAGVPYLTGLVRPCEIAQGHIDHAIAFAYQNPAPGYVYPATKSDGNVSGGMPEGTHLQLDPSIPDSTIQNTWHCTGPCFITAKALQKYGMYLIDHAGHPKLYFEYDGTANWNGTVSGSTVNPIPLSAFRVIDG